MKITLDTEEKKLIANQLYQLAINAAQVGDKKLHKALLSLANGFQENATVAYVRRYEAKFLLDTTKKTVTSLEKEILPKIEKSDKTGKDKDEAVATVQALITTSKGIIEKIQKRIKEADDNNKR